MCPYFYKNQLVVMYRKFRNVPILKDFPPICPYILGSRLAVASMQYCKSGNIRGTLIFAIFAQNSASANSNTREIFAIFCMHILDT